MICHEKWLDMETSVPEDKRSKLVSSMHRVHSINIQLYFSFQSSPTDNLGRIAIISSKTAPAKFLTTKALVECRSARTQTCLQSYAGGVGLDIRKNWILS